MTLGRISRIAFLIFSVVLLSAFISSSGGHPAGAAGGNAHAPIVIQSDGDFIACGCVLGGDGTQANPYVIGPWSINKYSGAGVAIDGTSLTKSFVLLNLTIAGNGGSNSQGILLKNINPSGTRNIVAQVKGAQTSINSAEVGIVVESSNYVTLDGGGANPNGAGIGNAGAGTINKQMLVARSTSRTAATSW